MGTRIVPSVLASVILLAAYQGAAQSVATNSPPSFLLRGNSTSERDLRFRLGVPLAYQHVAIAAMLKEVNLIGPKLGLPIHFPLTENDLVAAMSPPPDMKNMANPELPFWGGTVRTRQFFFSFSDNGRLCFVEKLRPWGRMGIAERNDMLAAQKSLIDTNGAYQMATNWLAQFPVDIARLERYGNANFADVDIKDVDGLVAKIQSAPDELNAYLKTKLGVLPIDDKNWIAIKLNTVVFGPSIYSQSRFRNASLRPEIAAFVKQVAARPESQSDQTRWNSLSDSALCNRMLLEDAYPAYLAKLNGNPPTIDHEFRWARESTNEKDYLPLFTVSWGVRFHGSPRIDIEIDGRTKDLWKLRLEDDSVSQRPVGLFKNRDELLKVSNQQFLSYSLDERKTFIERFVGQ
jgi:hypothetical protein